MNKKCLSLLIEQNKTFISYGFVIGNSNKMIGKVCPIVETKF